MISHWLLNLTKATRTLTSFIYSWSTSKEVISSIFYQISAYVTTIQQDFTSDVSFSSLSTFTKTQSCIATSNQKMQQSMLMDIFIWLTWAQQNNLQSNLKLDFEPSPLSVLIFLLRNSSLHGSLGLLSQGILFLSWCLELGCDSLRNAMRNPSIWKLFRWSSEYLSIDWKEYLKVPKELHWRKWKVAHFPPPTKAPWKTSNWWLLVDQAYGLFPQLQLEAPGKPKDGGPNTPEDLWEQI